MTTVASRWLLGASIVAGLVVAAACLRASDLARVERAARSPTDADVSGGAVSQEGFPTAEKRSTRDPSAEEEWRLEVELRDERGAPVAGRVYLTGLNGDLLDAADTTPPASLVQHVRGTIGLIAYVSGYVPRFFEELTPPPSGVRVLVVSLDHGPGISATVVDESGNPVSARVWAWPLDPPPWLLRKGESWKMYAEGREQWFRFRSSTDRDGRLHLEGLPPGRYELECGLFPEARRPGSPALLSPAPVTATVGDRNVLVVCRSAVEVRMRFEDAITGEPLPAGALVKWDARHEDWWKNGSGGWADGPTFEVAPGASFSFSVEVEGYISPEPMHIEANDVSGVQDVRVRFRPDPGGMAELDLIVRDDAGAPAATLCVTHGVHAQWLEAEDGRYALRIPAGKQHIELTSSDDQVLCFKPEWVPSAAEAEGHRTTHPYLRQGFDVEMPRGGRVTREVTMQRAALIWVRWEPEAGHDVRLMRRDTEIKDAFKQLPMAMGVVAAVEPGEYTLAGRDGGKIALVAKAAEVTEVWLRVESAR